MEKSRKKENYQLMLAQAEALFTGETNAIANLANASALLRETLPNTVFAGFYLYDGSELVLGPFKDTSLVYGLRLVRVSVVRSLSRKKL